MVRSVLYGCFYNNKETKLPTIGFEILFSDCLSRSLLTPGEGVLGFGLTGGGRLTPGNPYPCLGVILAENGTRF